MKIFRNTNEKGILLSNQTYKNLIIISILLLIVCNTLFSQNYIERHGKKISLDTNRIWSIKTDSVWLHSIFETISVYKKEKYLFYKKYQLDSVYHIIKEGNNILIKARIIELYEDTVSKQSFTTLEYYKFRSGGEPFFFKPLERDTIFRFPKESIQNIEIQMRPYRRTDGLALLGLIFMGTIATVSGTVAALKDDEEELYNLGVGVGFYTLAYRMIKRGRWIYSYKTSKNRWTINTNITRL